MQDAGMDDRQRHRRSAVKDHTGRSSRQRSSVEKYNVAILNAGRRLSAGRPVERDSPSAQQPFHLSPRAESRGCQVAVDPDCSGHDGLGRLFGGLVNRRMTAGGDERGPSTAFDRVARHDATSDV
jgi:hypothetical protein